jgi:hypothetical protein
MAHRDLQTILKASLVVVGTAAIISFDLPEGSAGTAILVGRGLLSIVFGASIISVEKLLPEPQPLTHPLPQMQLVLWGLGLFAVLLATNGWQWFEPSRNFWIGMTIALTIGFHKGFVWLWHQLAAKLGKDQT